jgi:hypothetical protein
MGLVEPTNGPATPTIVWNWRIFFPFELAAADPVPLAAADAVPIRPNVMIDPRTNTSHLFISRSFVDAVALLIDVLLDKWSVPDSRAAAANGSIPTAGIYANATIERCGRLLLEQLHVDLAAPA